MAPIYGCEIVVYLQDDQSVNVLVGSQQHYMTAIPENQFGLAVARVLKNERKTTRPVKNLLVVFNRQRSGSLGVIYITLTILRQRGQTGVL